MRNISVIGTGYVGLVTATAFADLGNKVTALDVVQAKIDSLRQGQIPIYEPGLQEVVDRNVKAGRLSFQLADEQGMQDALSTAEFVFICVGTPQGVDGEADLQYVRSAAETIGQVMEKPLIIINKSTVPVGTGDWVANIVRKSQPQPIDFSVVSCPEFLREGSAVRDFFNPDRIVLGSTDRRAADEVAQLHLPLRAPIIVTDLRTAEMIKYASNAFLATKISFINEIANICETLGADVKEVATGMGYDKRIGPQFLEAGVGYGGSCFPKDVQALAYMAQVHGSNSQMLQAVMDINDAQRKRVVKKLEDIWGSVQGKTIALLGLAFKQDTDDMRESPSITVADYLHGRGATVRGYDPVAMKEAAHIMPYMDMAEDAYDLARDADAIIVLTPWNEFKHLDMNKLKQLMREAVLIDGRNLYEPEKMRDLGFTYRGVGRGEPAQEPVAAS